MEAEKCTPKATAFCVGCVLVARLPFGTGHPTVLAGAYSRELDGNTHAEANALAKLLALSPEELSALCPSANLHDILAHTDVYTTMEPCSVRTSGLAPCADALIAAGVRRCFIGVQEPDDFVTCEGAMKLKDAGIEVIWVKGAEEKCLEVARKGHT